MKRNLAVPASFLAGSLVGATVLALSLYDSLGWFGQFISPASLVYRCIVTVLPISAATAFLLFLAIAAKEAVFGPRQKARTDTFRVHPSTASKAPFE